MHFVVPYFVKVWVGNNDYESKKMELRVRLSPKIIRSVIPLRINTENKYPEVPDQI